MRKRQTNLITAVLVLCVAILTLLALFVGDDEVSTTQSASAEETPVIAWEADIVPDTAPPVVVIEAAPEPVPRYATVSMSEDERREMAGIVFLEARNQCAEGQQAVAEVILNRVISPDFPDTVHDVLHQNEDTAVPQFSTIGNLALAEPEAAQYEAIDAALYGPSILPEDVVFFSRDGENDRVWGKIQDHVFCYKYIWE